MIDSEVQSNSFLCYLEEINCICWLLIEFYVAGAHIIYKRPSYKEDRVELIPYGNHYTHEQ